MQRRHSVRHLIWRGGVAAVSGGLMFTGLYPLVPHALRVIQRKDMGARPMRAALAEWGMALAVSAARPAGFLPLPGARTQGPRPVIVLHGYAMNRANFVPLAYRLARAILIPPRQNILCEAKIFSLPQDNSGLFGLTQGTRNMMSFRDNLNAIDGAQKIITFTFDGLFSRDVQ